ncbi:LPS export ABC transporter periplasmic protein LptC [Pseudomaricurvus sp. HS19]|uniref:LPS export ABC transporter periplasmic protein LptC n=1 Tax=Pseudomaricurvus sp. HS19 TaxID=2692626 RepID=UPI001368E646|nr:LPS export ABC transporter periplasmic protein LptC [Pseudomaricurvus sp. HS19]MYM64635.1 LPS export ABC transporter periplasmic protein LptC [Pseudomaricurvus sp. HS19]
MLKNWLTPLIVGGLVLAAILLWDTPPQNLLGEDPADAAPSSYPANIAYNLSDRHFDEAGALHSEFSASESRYFQMHPKRRTPDDYAELTEPRLTLYSDNKPPWHLSAKEGTARENGQWIELRGDVRIWQVTATGERSELTTTRLVVKPGQQYAETDKAVKLSAPGNTTEAVGMQAMLQQDLIKLLSRVRGRHEIQ